MCFKNNTKRAGRLRNNAVSMFKEAHDGIVEANCLLREQIAEDDAVITELEHAVWVNDNAVAENNKLLKQLEQFLPVG